MKKRLIIDTDPNIHVRGRDIDDALAILFCIASPEVEVEGITVNFGNVKAPVGYGAARDILRAAGADVPVMQGAASSADLGGGNEAVDFLVRSVKENPGEISLLALAPLTNVASACMLDEGFASGLRELVVMGGTLDFWIFKYLGEFNLHQDARAAATVLSQPIAKTLITMDVCAQAVFAREHLDRLRAAGSEVSRLCADFVAPWLKLNRVVFWRKKGFFPWDVVAASYLVDPTLFEDSPHTFQVVEEGLRRGRLRDVKRAGGFQGTNGKRPVNMPLELDGERFMDLFLARLLRL
ncbi:MAG: nucleoside hydrolase [Actinobacteria bacterium]|jgi:purine nucleosidase|nr:MAG: nucleoside hydrolase [Actinomycetota bacterium]